VKIEENCHDGQECFRHPLKQDHSHKKGGKHMKKDIDETSQGLNQIFEIINAKGDTGELKEIVAQNKESTIENDHQKQSE
jgi:hypothetical protein